MGCYPVPTQQRPSETSSPAASPQAPTVTTATTATIEPTTQPVEESTPPNQNRDELCLPSSQCKTSSQQGLPQPLSVYETEQTHTNSNAIPSDGSHSYTYVEFQKSGLLDPEENSTQKLPDEGYGTREHQRTSSTTVSTASSCLTVSHLQTSEWTGTRKTGTHDLGISSETEESASKKPVSKVFVHQQATHLLSTSTGPKHGSIATTTPHINQTYSESLSVPNFEATDRPPPWRSRHITEHAITYLDHDQTDPQDYISPSTPHQFLVSPTECHNGSQVNHEYVPYLPHHPVCSPYQRLAYPPHSIVVSGGDTSREGGDSLSYQFGVLLLKPKERDPLYRPPDYRFFLGMAGD